MEVIKEVTAVYHLKLTEEEARWLKSYIQNYMGMDHESECDEKLRHDLFNALKLVNY